MYNPSRWAVYTLEKERDSDNKSFGIPESTSSQPVSIHHLIASSLHRGSAARKPSACFLLASVSGSSWPSVLFFLFFHKKYSWGPHESSIKPPKGHRSKYSPSNLSQSLDGRRWRRGWRFLLVFRFRSSSSSRPPSFVCPPVFTWCLLGWVKVSKLILRHISFSHPKQNVYAVSYKNIFVIALKTCLFIYLLVYLTVHRGFTLMNIGVNVSVSWASLKK